MQVKIITESLIKWMEKNHPCQIKQTQAFVQQSYTRKQISDASMIGQQLVNHAIRSHNLVIPKTQFVGLELEMGRIQTVVTLIDYRYQELPEQEQILAQQLALAYQLQTHFQNQPVVIVVVLPQLAPALIIRYEQLFTQLRVLVKQLQYAWQWQLVIEVQGITQASEKKAEQVTTKVVSGKVIVQLQRYRAKIPGYLWSSLQNIAYVKSQFGIEYPLLMSRTNFLKSGYERRRFAKKLLIIKGKEYYVFDQLTVAQYHDFERWLSTYNKK